MTDQPGADRVVLGLLRLPSRADHRLRVAGRQPRADRPRPGRPRPGRLPRVGPVRRGGPGGVPRRGSGRTPHLGSGCTPERRPGSAAGHRCTAGHSPGGLPERRSSRPAGFSRAGWHGTQRPGDTTIRDTDSLRHHRVGAAGNSGHTPSAYGSSTDNGALITTTAADRRRQRLTHGQRRTRTGRGTAPADGRRQRNGPAGPAGRAFARHGPGAPRPNSRSPLCHRTPRSQSSPRPSAASPLTCAAN